VYTGQAPTGSYQASSQHSTPSAYGQQQTHFGGLMTHDGIDVPHGHHAANQSQQSATYGPPNDQLAHGNSSFQQYQQHQPYAPSHGPSQPMTHSGYCNNMQEPHAPYIQPPIPPMSSHPHSSGSLPPYPPQDTYSQPGASSAGSYGTNYGYPGNHNAPAPPAWQ